VIAVADRARLLGRLAEAGITLTLVDVGASLEPFAPFQPLLGAATYVGFDPDRRELHTSTSSSGPGRRIVLDQAVVADPDADEATFFLTANPTCSSTLRPRPEAVDDYLHAYRFEVVGEATVPATTLVKALAGAGIDRVDWLKLDTQGTDLRLLDSLDDALAGTLMAVDAEPGLDPYYEGEDTFGELHRALVARGFWLADLDLIRAVRLRRTTYDDLLAARTRLRRRLAEFTLKSSPTAAGPRYLRTLASLEARQAERDDYLRLWGCAFFSGNRPYALDVVAACRDRHGTDPPVPALLQATVRANRADIRRATPGRLVEKASWRNLRRFLTKPY
jgi:FkbM family methyltransferase